MAEAITILMNEAMKLERMESDATVRVRLGVHESVAGFVRYLT